MRAARFAPTLPLLAAACASSSPPVTSPPAPHARIEPPASVAPTPEAGRLPTDVLPLRYTLSLHVDPTRTQFEGTQRVELRITRPTATLVLDARSLDFTRVTLRTADGVVHAMHALHDRPGFERAIDFGDVLPTGNATLEVDYTGTFNDQSPGLFRTQSDGQWYAFTDFEPADARRAFPCFDEPALKASWDVRVTVPSGLAAFANMPEVSRTDDPSHHETTVAFAPTPPIASYLVALAIGPLDTLDGPPGPVRIRAIAPHGRAALAREALIAADRDLRVLAAYFDRPYPYPKLDLVAVPGFQGAMENPGLVTFAESEVLLDPDHAAIDAHREMATTLAHELSHQWFGDLVTMAWWDDLWLNEGFATWMEARVVDQLEPTWGARLDALRGRARGVQLDALPEAHAVRQPVRDVGDAMASFDSITYQKGAAISSMLEAWLGPDVFRAGVRRYIHDHASRNATAQDLFDALEAVAPGRPVTAVAHGFVDQPGIPLVTADLVCADGAAPTLSLQQEPFTSTAPARRWRIPVCYDYDADGSARHACTLLDEATAHAPLPGATHCPRWFDPNPQLAGYYLFALTPAVRTVRESPAWAARDAATRWGLLDDARTLFAGGRLDAAALLAELDAYRTEREPHTVESVTTVFAAFDRNFVADEDRAALRRHIAVYLAPIAHELGLHGRENESDDRRLLRRTVLATLAAHGDDARVTAEAERAATAFLRRPDAVDAEEISWALPLATHRAGAPRFDALVAAMRRPGLAPELAELLAGALGSFDDPALLERALSHAFSGALRANEAFDTLHAALVAPERRAVAVRWVRAHFDAVAQRLDGLTLANLPEDTAGGACSDDEVEAERTFWRDRVAHIEGGARALSVGLARATQCATLRARSQPSLHAVLAVGRGP